MSALAETLRSLAHVFGEQGLRWYVFGAQAVVVRGAPRATQDVDVTVFVEPEGRRAMVSALIDAGLRHRFPDIAEQLIDAGAVLAVTHPSGMDIDLVFAGTGLERLAMERATTEALAGVPVPVVQATELVVMKVLAGRGKDLDDVQSLLVGGEVDLDEARDLLGQLEAALGQSDLLPRLEQCLRDA